MQAKIIPTSSCSEKSGKTGKNAPSVTGGQRAVTFCAGVPNSKIIFRITSFLSICFVESIAASSLLCRKVSTTLELVIVSLFRCRPGIIVI